MDRLLLILLGSLVVVIQTWLSAHGENFWWTLAMIISGISAVLCIVLLLVIRCGAAKAGDLTHGAAALLVAMWLVGTACMTLKAPYTFTGNGYFGAWLALIFSWLLAVDHFPSLRAPLDHLVANGGTLVAMLTLASMVVFCQTLWIVIDHGFDHGEVVWLFVCSGLSLFVLLLLHVRSVSESVRDSFNLIAIFLFLWWCVGWFIGTFNAPYRITGNGFFGCWVALISSFLLADSAGGLRLQQRAESGSACIPRSLLGLALGSIVVFTAVTYNGCWGGHGTWCTWAFICSCVSMVMCIFLCIVIAVGSGDKVASAIQPTAIFLLIWWTAGTGIMTFEHPFKATSNGYFGAWLALVSAAILCHDHAQCFRNVLARFGNYGRILVLLFIASVTLLVQVVSDTLDDYDVLIGWIVGGASLTICLVMVLSQANEDFLRVFMIIMFLLWATGVGALTFDSPYVWTGNAYFALWFGLALSSLAVWRLYPDCVRKAMPEAGAPPAVVVGNEQVV